MDPFFAASTPAARTKRRTRHSLPALETRDSGPSESQVKEPQPKALCSTSASTSSKSLTGLRRSTGLFNLKINKDDTQSPLFSEATSPVDDSSTRDMSNSDLTTDVMFSDSPTKTVSGSINDTPISRRKRDMLSLKRPHPFSTSKPSSKQWGFLSRSSNSSLASPQKSKRLHVLDSSSRMSHSDYSSLSSGSGSDSTATINPDSSFSGAKPVQTAFTSTGLQSKKHAPQTPKPRIPETPVKRPLNADTSANQKHYLYQSNSPLDHGSPFPGVRSNQTQNHNPMQLDQTKSSSTDSLNSWLESSVGNRLHTPIDRLKRFSIGHIDESDINDTPTKHAEKDNERLSSRHKGQRSQDGQQQEDQQSFSATQHYQFPGQTKPKNSSASSTTSRQARTPSPPLPVGNNAKYDDSDLEFYDENCKDSGDDEDADLLHRFQDCEDVDSVLPKFDSGAGRQGSEAITVTPGTAVKPTARPIDSQVLRSADPTDSMSMSPLWSRDTMSFADTTGPKTPGKFANESLPSPTFAESQSSPIPRHRLRISNGLRQNDKSPVPKVMPAQGLRSIPSSASTAVSSGSANNSFGSANNISSSGSSVSSDGNDADDEHPNGNADSDDKPVATIPGMPSIPPPLRLETPLGRSHFELSPKTPATTTSFFESPSSESDSNKSVLVTSHPTGRSDRSSIASIVANSSIEVEDGNSHLPYPRSSCINAREPSITVYSDSGLRGCNASRNFTNRRPKDEDPSLYDPHLISKFEKVQSAAKGEFSCVFVVIQGRQRFAVKRTKKPLIGQRDRARQREEIDILRTSSTQPNDSHVIQMVDDWEYANFGYIMTEFCENGDLNTFSAAQGRVSRLEEWRVWKISVEVLHGLAVIHSHNILHLDSKPANVFVSFEGHLKIGDFGIATRCPPPPGFEREGDREYIAPEVLEKHQYGKPADIFSVGLMMVEVAANIVLPDNGVHWHRSRSGDLSDAGRLSSGDLNVGTNSANSNASGGSNISGMSQNTAAASSREIPKWAPRFLVDDSCSLDKVVSLMLSPQPERRPTVAQLLTMPESMLVYQRGQAGAIVYEGEFGPEPEMAEENSVWQRA